MHPGGVNIALADGAIRFLSDSIDYRVYQSLLAPNDAQGDAPRDEFKHTIDFQELSNTPVPKGSSSLSTSSSLTGK